MKTLLFLCLVAPSKGSGDWIRTLLSHTSFGIPNVRALELYLNI